MTAHKPTSGDGQERTDSEEEHLFEEETLAGDMAGQAFFAPERAAVDVRTTPKGGLKIRFRPATNNRGLEMTWMVAPSEAREIVDELTEALEAAEE
jgi:hypothetical protein